MTKTNKPKMLFEMGSTTITPRAIDAVREQARQTNIDVGFTIAIFLTSHSSGDWGELDEHDAKANEEALTTGGRIMSVYHLQDKDATKVWVITDGADSNGVRHTTTILLPEDY